MWGILKILNYGPLLVFLCLAQMLIHRNYIYISNFSGYSIIRSVTLFVSLFVRNGIETGNVNFSGAFQDRLLKLLVKIPCTNEHPVSNLLSRSV